MRYTKDHPLRNRLTKRLFLRLYEQDGLTIRELAARFKTSEDAVFRLRRAYGIEARLNQEHNKGYALSVRGRMEGVCSPGEARTLYWEQSQSLDDIARQFSVTRKGVSKFFKRHGIPVRPRDSARRLAVLQGKVLRARHQLTPGAFHTWTPSMAWTLGVLFTRGLITLRNRNDRRLLTVIATDSDFLDRIRSNLGSTHPVICRNRPGSRGEPSIRLQISNAALVEDLVSLGVLQDRAQRRLTTSVPPKCVASFVRGVYEAPRLSRRSLEPANDGRLIFRHQSAPFLGQVRVMLTLRNIESSLFVTDDRNSQMRTLEYDGPDAERLLDLMYAPDVHGITQRAAFPPQGNGAGPLDSE